MGWMEQRIEASSLRFSLEIIVVAADSARVMRPVVLLALPWLLLSFVLESRAGVYLPYAKVFKGDSEFEELVQKAQRENWRSLPLGQRTAAVGLALLGTPYAGYTLEIDDHTESPSVNLRGVDCWTYFEISVGFARMLELKTGGYTPADLLAMIELDRYRGGRCNGKYTSRLHYLEDWIYDNERRGLVTNLTRSLGGVPMRGRYLNEMSKYWRDSRYLRNNRELVPDMRQIENNISSRTIYHIPKREVPEIESRIQDGDVICISGNGPEGFTEHVGLAYRDRAGVLHFMHASKDARRVIVDVPLHSYLYRYSKFAGIMVVRPREVASSAAAVIATRSAKGGNTGTVEE